MKKKAPHLQQVKQAVLQHLRPEHIEVAICRADELARRRGWTSELDEMWSYVGKKAEPRWLWHAIDHTSGCVLADVFGRRQDTVFVQLKALSLNLSINWLQVLGATELAQIDQRVRHQFHAIVPLLDTFKS